MSHCHTYPAQIERDEDGRYVVTFSDFGWGATDGARFGGGTHRSQGSAQGTHRGYHSGRLGITQAIECAYRSIPHRAATSNCLESSFVPSLQGAKCVSATVRARPQYR